MPDSLRDTLRDTLHHAAIFGHYQHNYTCNKVARRIFPCAWCKYWTARI